MRLTIALLACVAAVAVAPATASAVVTTTIGFDDLPAGTPVDTQYQGSKGVTFALPSEFGVPGYAELCPRWRTEDGGISGRSLYIGSCYINEFHQKFGTAFGFDFEQKTLRFALRRGNDVYPANDFRVDVLGVGGTVLASDGFSLSPGGQRTVSFARPTAEIATVVIHAPNGLGYSRFNVHLDDIVATRDDTPAPPKYAVGLTTPSVDVVEGGSASAPITVRRFNGSSGPVTLTPGALPPGLAAAQVEPNPVTGRAPATLRIASVSPFSGERQLAVSASGGPAAGTAVRSQVVQTVKGISALSLEGRREPIRVVPGCGRRSVDDSFTVRGGYRGRVGVVVRSLSPGFGAAALTGSVQAAGDGSVPIRYAVEQLGADGSGELEVELRPEGATPVSARVTVLTDRARFERVSPQPLALSRFDSRAELTVIGNFPSSCDMRFEDTPGKRPYEIVRRDQADIDGRLWDRVTLRAPADAVSGGLHAIAPDGREIAAATIQVREWRNRFALATANAGSEAGTSNYTWDEFARTYGTDDTDACFVFCVRDPIAVDYYEDWLTRLRARTGLCFGYAVMAMRFAGFQSVTQRPGDYQPGAGRAWDIAPVMDGTAVKRDIVRWHTAQYDKPLLADEARSKALSAADAVRRLRDLIDNAGAALVTIRQGNAGHAVVAYGYTPVGGGLMLKIYDPNVPYVTAEETTTATRSQNLIDSSILVQANGDWRGSSLKWSGTKAALGVIGFLPSSDAKLPNDFSLASLLGTSGDRATAKVAGIRAGGRAALKPDGTALPGSGVDVLPALTGVLPEPQYQLQRGREYAFAIEGARPGTYRHALRGEGVSVAASGARTTPGVEDKVTVSPGRAEIGFKTGARSSPVTLDVAARSGKATRTASVALAARRGGGDEVSLGGGALRVRHDGAATSATVTLGAVGGAVPAGVTTAPVRLGRGTSLILRPRSWNDLAGGVRYTLRRGGRVIRRGNVRLRQTAKVRVSGVRARLRRSGGRARLTVTGRVTRRGSAPVLAATARVGGRRRAVSRRGGAVRAGRFSLPLSLGRVRRGARIRVTVHMLDESAGLATIRRAVTVRG